MTRTASVLILTRDSEIGALADLLRAEEITAQVVSPGHELRLLLQSPGDYIAVVDGNLPSGESIQAFELLHGSRPIPTLLLVPSGDPWQFGMKLDGHTLDDFVRKPVKLPELLFRVKALMLKAGYELPELVAKASNGAGGHEEEIDGFRQGKIVAVFSAKGGVGKSTIAVNLAIGLNKFYRKKTLVVDGDLSFGDIGILLNIHTKKSIFDLCAEDNQLPGQAISISDLMEALVQIRPGAQALLRPPDLIAVEKLDRSAIVTVLTMYRSLFDFVVVDTHTSLGDLNLQILDAANQILLVSTPEMSSISNTARFLHVADTLGYTDRISLIINRANYGIDLGTLEASLGMEASGRVVSAGPQVVEAANEGSSLFQKDPEQRKPITQDLARIVALVAGQPEPKSGTKPGKQLSLLRLPFARRNGK